VRISELVKPGEDYVGQLKINAAGEIDVPSVGLVKVEGQRADEIEKTLIGRLGKILANPDKLVRVDRFMNGMMPAMGRAG
jgi:protein involved in polysaccharide export with SLBB domain